MSAALCNRPLSVSTLIARDIQGYMGILVVLKFRFAKVVALAVSIGNHLRPVVAKIVGPALAFLMPNEYHQVMSFIVHVGGVGLGEMARLGANGARREVAGGACM